MRLSPITIQDVIANQPDQLAITGIDQVAISENYARTGKLGIMDTAVWLTQCSRSFGLNTNLLEDINL